MNFSLKTIIAFYVMPMSLLAFISCSDAPKDPVLAKIETACQGIDQEISSLTFGKPLLGGIYYDGEFHSGLKGISIKITGSIAADPGASGNHCEYYLTEKEDRVVTMKDACASLCVGSFVDTRGNNFEMLTK